MRFTGVPAFYPPRSIASARRRGRSYRRRGHKARNIVLVTMLAAAFVVAIYLVAVAAPSGPPVPCSSGYDWIHIHPYLSISISGTSVPVPGGIGALNGGSCLEELHTDDASGSIHIGLSRTDPNSNYTLGDFFRVWAATYPTVTIGGASRPVIFTNDDIFGFTTNSTNKVLVLVDGKPIANGVGIPLEQHDYCVYTEGGPPPCVQMANVNPLWEGAYNYPYRTGHAVEIEYVRAG